MCRATTMEDVRPTPTLDIRAFYLRLSSSSSPAPADLALVYLPAIGGAALRLNGRALPPAAPAEVTLRQVAGDAYASADRVAAAEGARFEVYAGKEMAAEGVFRRRRGAGEVGWRVECRRAGPVAVAEVMVLAEGGVLMRDRARAASRRGVGCGGTRLEGIPEDATDLVWGCQCGSRGDEEWEVVSDDGEPWKEEEVEVETVRWAMEMGVWAVCLGVGLLATARRFRRKRAFW
ncbi:uncharacterized protein LOC120692548 [Panicum virgatum]|uniref:Uncharacterized protein n=1 Tax=Panicum virgatum TaxID=38727 RepID=A0A8T0N7A7_PANVG|nr:uncharacterized protein LOC120692548 [Panicum virgatum]KAG2544029.1 hypothetical protein PVAP13_9NG785900 [Panicum virgatum]